MRDFLDLVWLTNYPDCLLCVFYNTNLNDQSMTFLPGDGSQGSIAQYVEWMLLNCGSHFTIYEAEEEELVSPVPAMDTETKNEPTIDLKPATDPLLELTTATEPESATTSVPEPDPATRAFAELPCAVA